MKLGRDSMVDVRPAARVAAAALVIVASAIAAGGCGGSNHAGSTTAATTTTSLPAVKLGKTSYERRMRVLGNRLGRSVTGLYPLASGSKGSETAKQTMLKLQTTQAVASSVLVQLRRIVPPKPIAREHGELEAGVRQLIAQIGMLITDIQVGNIRDFVAGSNFTVGLRMINAAANAMTDHGYNILGPDAAINP